MLFNSFSPFFITLFQLWAFFAFQNPACTNTHTRGIKVVLNFPVKIQRKVHSEPLSNQN